MHELCGPVCGRRGSRRGAGQARQPVPKWNMIVCLMNASSETPRAALPGGDKGAQGGGRAATNERVVSSHRPLALARNHKQAGSFA